MSSTTLRLIFVLTFIALLSNCAPIAAQQQVLERIDAASPEQLQRLLPKYPAADTNKDGILSRNEARDYVKNRINDGRRSDKSGMDRTQNPDFENVKYGSHPRNRMDVWKSTNDVAQPMVVFIHGGGFQNGDKLSWRQKPDLQRALERGFAVAAINYPFRKDRPIQAILKDAGRAVQFLRSRAVEYHFDPDCMIGWGGSAGAGTSLWLTTRDDLADSTSADLVSRQSSRLQAAVLHGTQATYDLTRWDEIVGPARPEWRASENEVAEFYHLRSLQQLETPAGKAILEECDMLRWISVDDGPIWISNSPNRADPRSRGQYLHHFRHAEKIAQVCKDCQVLCELVDTKSNSPSALEFVVEQAGRRNQGQFSTSQRQ